MVVAYLILFFGTSRYEVFKKDLPKDISTKLISDN